MRVFFVALQRWAQALRRWILGRREERPRGHTAVWAEDVPVALEPDLVYFIGGDQPVFAVMVCPCGCGSRLHLNMLPEARPRWACEVAATGEVTLYPSVWQKAGCRSHFFLRGGHVVWV